MFHTLGSDKQAVMRAWPTHQALSRVMAVLEAIQRWEEEAQVATRQWVEVVPPVDIHLCQQEVAAATLHPSTSFKHPAHHMVKDSNQLACPPGVQQKAILA